MDENVQKNKVPVRSITNLMLMKQESTKKK